MSRLKDMTGSRHGRLFVTGRDCNNKSRTAKWICRCDCGKLTSVRGDHLRLGRIISCGCKNDENRQIGLKYKHGMSNTRLFRIWKHMIERCGSPKCKDYRNYGGRGITVCKEWSTEFIKFYLWAIKNGYKDTLSIDRINCNGNYEPSNCRWVGDKEQANNTRRNHFVVVNGETHTVTEWSEKLNIEPYMIFNRLKRGHDIEEYIKALL